MAGIKSPKEMGRISLIVLATALAGCESVGSGNLFQASEPIPAPPEPPADTNGVISYANFRVMLAREGDTIEAMANRVGLPELVLARYNGLPANYLLREGDRLALPDEAQVAAVQQGWTPEVVTGVLDDLPDTTQTADVPQPPGNLPTRHRVEAGETVFSIAKLYGVSVTALASWNGLGGDLEVATGRSLIIPTSQIATTISTAAPEVTEAAPIPAPTPAPAAPKPATETAVSEPGESSTIVAPPSAAQPLPENPVKVEIPEGPDLGATQTTSSGDKMVTPVQGKVLRPFSAAPGARKNDGIDYATAKGATVKAAASGEVALVSPSIGLGQIILIRHRDNIISVYGRMSNDIRVKKGQKVRKGEVIGTVADGNPPTFHFEVRRGTQAVDPTPFL